MVSSTRQRGQLLQCLVHDRLVNCRVLVHDMVIQRWCVQCSILTSTSTGVAAIDDTSRRSLLYQHCKLHTTRRSHGFRKDTAHTLLYVEKQGSEGRVLQGVEITDRASGGVLYTFVWETAPIQNLNICGFNVNFTTHLEICVCQQLFYPVYTQSCIHAFMIGSCGSGR